MTPVITAAFKSWADVSPLKFAKAGKGMKGDITIGFFPRYHDDGNPFGAQDFAHAYLPEDGRLHYNANWGWTFDPTKKGEKRKVDVQSIGVHEIGHTLGLDHSADKSAVMYPYFAPGMKKRDLTDDDKKGIKALYPE
ncbi:hypothetical protein like AT4G16640 [Hibiscus trionum]|uniref:Peptidase metallopeptidase domain-containing protein n=1 Tax=Hibiscus trionum TaxID=183268 RepID=A0A9W7ILA0_HIBTR|nr:hypothetical protein like AT4G16640 [Hibiscus trionum]